MKKIISIFLVISTLFCVLAVSAGAASYSTGTYAVNTSSGVNVRSGAGTGYSIVGAASNGISFSVSKTSGSWGYTSSIKCTNGTRSGWVCLDYCKYKGSSNSSRSSYNDVFASLKGSGYSLSQARNSEATSFKKGDHVYVWAWVHDANNNLYKSYSSGTCNMTLSIYRPDGSCAFTYTYNNSDNNWIGHTLDRAGTWKIQSKITGSISGTNTRTITVKESSSTVNPTGVSLNYSSVTINNGSSKTISATISPSNATNKTVTWSTNNSSVATVSNGTITGKAPGTATITAKSSNGKTASCTVTVKGIVIKDSSTDWSSYLHVGDVYTLYTSSYGVSSSKTFSSSNSSVLSVTSSGKITAKKAGTAIITVRTADGYTASCSYTVSSNSTTATGSFSNKKAYTTVRLNAGVSAGYITINSYDGLGLKTSAKLHVCLTDYNGNWICEFNTTSGTKLKLGNDHREYRVYVSPGHYDTNGSFWKTVINGGNKFTNDGKCVTWKLTANSNCYIF